MNDRPALSAHGRGGPDSRPVAFSACNPRNLRSIMKRIAYTVCATLPDEETAGEFVAWLEGGHIQEVISGGAHSAMIVRMDHEGASQDQRGARPRIEVRYIFLTREAFDRYVLLHAPRLRAEGLRRFPTERGIAFSRSVGEIL